MDKCGDSRGQEERASEREKDVNPKKHCVFERITLYFKQNDVYFLGHFFTSHTACHVKQRE